MLPTARPSEDSAVYKAERTSSTDMTPSRFLLSLLKLLREMLERNEPIYLQ